MVNYAKKFTNLYYAFFIIDLREFVVFDGGDFGFSRDSQLDKRKPYVVLGLFFFLFLFSLRAILNIHYFVQVTIVIPAYFLES